MYSRCTCWAFDTLSPAEDGALPPQDNGNTTSKEDDDEGSGVEQLSLVS